jgi:hypothetical protein
MCNQEDQGDYYVALGNAAEAEAMASMNAEAEAEADNYYSEQIESIIDSIHVNTANFEHIAKTGVINGNLRQSLRDILKSKHKAK